MEVSTEDNQIGNKASGCRIIARKMAVALLVLISAPILVVSCCALTRFPPQIFGKNEDHFRAFVIDPIPESVEIINVEFDDIMIHPDIAYFFQFSVSRSDLEKIITSNSLQPTDDECFDPSPSPSWWKFPSPNNLQIYQYESDGVIISLCYDTASTTAFYAFWTY
jgi:hypothetical protein